MMNLVGQSLGNYRLIRLLGQGGFAEVYLGVHIHLGNNAAIKVLSTRLPGDQVELFRNEARTIVNLVHPNIVKVLDFGIEANTGTPFLVMDAAQGTLRERHPRGSVVPMTTILPYVKQVATALQYAHDHKLIHQDVKPENMLVGANGHILLSDFGIAVIAHSSSSLKTQRPSGTPLYMAPEVFAGKPRPASDQYALAIVVYEWLSGKCPFQGNIHALPFQHMSVAPPPFDKNLRIPSPVEDVVRKALAKDPENRFPSVEAFARDLEQASQPTLSSPPVISPNPPVREQQSPPIVPTLAMQNYETPPARQQANPTTGPNTRRPDVVSASSNTLPDMWLPVTSGTSPPPAPGNRQQPWLILLGVMLALMLVIGGVLVGLQLNKGGSGSNPSTGGITTTSSVGTAPATSHAQTAVPTSPPQPAVIPKGPQLYFSPTPGACNYDNLWGNYNHAIVSCTASGTQITNPHPKSSQGSNLAGILLSLPNGQSPNDYVIEVQLQQLNTSSSEFGVYFRNQPGSLPGVYTFLIRPDRTWHAYVYDNVNGIPKAFASGPFSNPYTSVLIDVVVRGNKFTFYANNQFVGGASDSTYPTGNVGIAVETEGSIFASNFALYTIA